MLAMVLLLLYIIIAFSFMWDCGNTANIAGSCVYCAKQTIWERALAIWKLVTWFLIFMTSQCAFQSFLFIMCLVCDVIICGHVPGAILHAYL